MPDYSSRFKAIRDTRISEVEKAKIIIYFRTAELNEKEVCLPGILKDFRESGFNDPNMSRLAQKLGKERDLVTGSRQYCWRLTEAGLLAYEEKYSPILKKKIIKPSDSVLPLEIVENTRGYIEKIAGQINTCYDGVCFDASLVMMRKLLEVCLIEAFESKGKRSLIVDVDGNYLQLSGIINKALDQNPLGLTRNNKTFLKERRAKKRGDLAAHNPRFVAVRKDIDNIAGDFRVIIQELIIISGTSK